MSKLPTNAEVLDAIDRLPPDWTSPSGRAHVSWRNLAFELFPKGSPFWIRPTNQPHGLDQSPAYFFMERLAFEPGVAKVRISGKEYFARREP